MNCVNDFQKFRSQLTIQLNRVDKNIYHLFNSAGVSIDLQVNMVYSLWLRVLLKLNACISIPQCITTGYFPLNGKENALVNLKISEYSKFEICRYFSCSLKHKT